MECSTRTNRTEICTGRYPTRCQTVNTASPTSIVNRGRKIVYRITDPGLPGIPTQEQIDDYAKDVLSEASSLEYTITFTHGYYPCRPGDCVRLNYKRAGLQDIKAKIISQNITCDSGVKVKTTAVFTKKLWSQKGGCNMALSKDVMSQFAKAMVPKQESKEETGPNRYCWHSCPGE